MAAFDIAEEGGQPGGCGDGQECVTILGGVEKVQEGREEKSGCFLFGGEAEELGVEG